ncbi:family 16 glycosylhydrolase [Flavobacterium sp. AG291]|uniref:glycoside hydrolase family 16 protein n=1 Tax=Flavobacterium sp. AG291 TaxID=2184000 RepID=UPI000E0BEDC5|nr:family 16 glycosylhydrolase [Flavobacterium sp. AG291]RDI15724.1 beta-glucanase (GH16 family) [Flavobacterium sp. AG291]
MKNVLKIAVLLLALTGCSSSEDAVKNNTQNDFDLDEAALEADGYSKIYEDNFDSGLNGWNVWEGGAYNEELQLYKSQNLILANGILEIRSKKEDVTGPATPGDSELSDFDYTSGRIESIYEVAHTSTSQKIRISARIKLPASYGMWPAFWSYGNPWPTHGEIDILEATGDKHGYTTNYYYGSQPDTPQTNDDLTSEEITTPKDLSSGFHVYEVIWAKNSLTFLLDGEVVETRNTSETGQQYIPDFFGKSQNIILNLAVGGTMFGDDFDESEIKTSSMYVDWVKVFSSQ